MGVSISENSNVDLNAIVAGGDAFMSRLKALQQAKADADAALTGLNLGMDIIRAQQDLQQREANAMKMIEDAKAQVEKVLEDASREAAATKGFAQTVADDLLAKAKAQSDAVDQEVAIARAAVDLWSTNTRAAAQTLLDQANAKNSRADAILAANQSAADDLASAQKAADEALAKANTMQATLNAKLEAIRVAAS